MDITSKNNSLTQRIMADLAGVVTPTISKHISSNNIAHLPTNLRKNNRYTIEDARRIIKSFSTHVPNILRKKHAFYNFKGGTGKTSICFQVASHLALMGYNVLVIDADPQAHLSISLRIIDDKHFTLYDVIKGVCALDDTIVRVYEGLDCIPSNISLTKLEGFLFNVVKREEKLKIDLKGLEAKYDFILIDTNPAISMLNRNIINYVDILNIVCETQPYSLNGLKILIEDLKDFLLQMQTGDKILNIIPNKYEDRSSNSGEAMSILRKYYSEYLKKDFAIRKSEDFVTSSKMSLPLAFFVKKNSNAWVDINDLLKHIINISTESGILTNELQGV